MALFKLRHKPTGLFFCPSRTVNVYVNGQRYRVKSNLSVRGKIYQVTPSFEWCSPYYNHLEAARRIEDGESTWTFRGSRGVIQFKEDDWEIVKLES